MSVMIGIDPHKGSHAAVAVDEHEEALAEVQVRATLRQTSELLGWAQRFPTRSWAIESVNGHGYLLAQQLVAAGEHVVDVPATLAARVRVLGSSRSQKNDPNDARSVAIVVRRQPGLRVVGCAYLIWPHLGPFRSFDLAPPVTPIPTLGGFCEEARRGGRGRCRG